MDAFNKNEQVRVRKLPYSIHFIGQIGRVVGQFGALITVVFAGGKEAQYLPYELERVS